MQQIEIFDQHTAEYEEWFKKYPAVFDSEVLAIREQLQKLPANLSGIEVGLGTGRFAEALGIHEGVEPAGNMRQMAMDKGIEVMDARAERLPYKSIHFDFVLFVTICHLDNVPDAFEEAYRVLKPGGSIIVGMIKADGPIGQEYEERRKRSTFYHQATFYEVRRINTILKEAGFKDLEYVQTLFGKLDDITKVQAPQEGWQEGSFVVIKATRK